ncbi:hypothetical protein LP420_31115 [Massilia sp. B-10]|nr:hypothetical protein LP420_31115 [Massilia sp. B-10]
MAKRHPAGDAGRRPLGPGRGALVRPAAPGRRQRQPHAAQRLAALHGRGRRPPRRAGHSTTGQLPYAIAIACGTLLQLALRDWPAWHVFS